MFRNNDFGCKGTKNFAYIKKKLYLCSRIMKRTVQIIIAACLSVVSVWAADETTKPAYQIADNTFFDPTRKVEQTEKYEFGVEYRIEAGFVQHHQRTRDLSYPQMYLHGVRLGATFTFNLPVHFGLQTGLLYMLQYGSREEHWRSMDAPSAQTEFIRHHVLSHNLTVPVRVFYTIPLWKQLNLFFYGGPQLHIGLAQSDYPDNHITPATEAWLSSIDVPVKSYDRYAGELLRANIQLGVGGGLEWDRYRLQAGYDFGLNNLVRQQQTIPAYLSEWGWYVSFSYRL